MTTTEQSTKSALWVPGWYELDQPLTVGESGRLWFYQNPPLDVPEVESYDFVFFNQLSAAANCQVRTANINSIEHPHLGSIRQIDTDGLDYVIVTVSGDHIVVNAEEEPGRVYDNPVQIDDWSMAVTLSNVSEPLVDTT